MRHQLEERLGVELQSLPNTKLAKEKIKTREMQLKAQREHRRVVRAVDAFLKVLRRHNVDRDASISRSELQAAILDEQMFTKKRRRRIFGDVDNETIMKYLDRDGNGQITFPELMRFIEETGVNLQTRFLGYERKNVSSLLHFFSALQDTLLTNVKRIYVEERDIERTVGINTGHVGTTDFVLEDEDIDFMIERGRRSVIAFLKYYVANNDPPKKPLPTCVEGKMMEFDHTPGLMLAQPNANLPYMDEGEDPLGVGLDETKLIV